MQEHVPIHVVPPASVSTVALAIPQQPQVEVFLPMHPSHTSNNPEGFETSEPPSYEQLQENQQNQGTLDQPPAFASHSDYDQGSQYSNLGPNEYPEEKKSDPFSDYTPSWSQAGAPRNPQNGSDGGYGHSSNGIPPGMYSVPPQKANITYDTQGSFTRPGYKEFLENDRQRVAQGDVPQPRSAFGRKGAPLAPSKQGSGGGFPGGPGATYYSSSN